VFGQPAMTVVVEVVCAAAVAVCVATGTVGVDYAIKAGLWRHLRQFLRNIRASEIVTSASPRSVANEFCAGSSPATADEFQELVEFLQTVPLLHTQLPEAELPMLASAMTRLELEPGSTLFEQGQQSKAFYIVEKGKASCVAVDADGEVSGRALLLSGDYVGAKALTTGRRMNFATVRAEPPNNLVVLRMLRADFEKLGLHKKLKLTKRPAVYNGQRLDRLRLYSSLKNWVDDGGDATLSASEIDFIHKSVSQNPNLRALRDVSDNVVRSMASGATKRNIDKGHVLFKGGEFGLELFVVASGRIDIASEAMHGARDARNAEARIMHNTLNERVLRKRQFLETMLSMGTAQNGGQSMSHVLAHRTSGLRNFRARALSDRAKTLENEGPPDEIFKVGANVRIVAGLVGSRDTFGKVIDNSSLASGEVVVKFSDEVTEVCKVEHLSAVDTQTVLSSYGAGECFGEMALLYNTRRVGTAYAATDSKVYVIAQEVFKECFGRSSKQIEEFTQLLGEVPMLAPLLSFEREEMARNANGVVTFSPGERVLHQGEPCQNEQWYIVKEGSCIINKTENDAGKTELARLGRGGHFGEHAILLKHETHTFSVDAGPEGMSCLTIDGGLLYNLNENLQGRDLVLDVLNLAPGVQDVRYSRPSLTTTKTHAWRAKSVSGVPGLTLRKLQFVTTIGQGAFGKVYLVRDTVGGRDFAIKQMSKGYILQTDMVKRVMTERDILRIIDNPFIVRCYRTFKDDQHVYFLMEHAPGSHLQDLISFHWDLLMKDTPRGSSAAFYTGCIALALDYLHDRHIAYRDLKLENVLLDAKGYVKLCDMGFARLVLKETNTFLGTAEYIAPEMIDFPHSHGTPVDWWALGVLTCELLSGQPPWDVESSEDPMEHIMEIRRFQERGVPKGLIDRQLSFGRDFVTKLLTVNPLRRLGARRGIDEVKEHSWFRMLDMDFMALNLRTLPAPWEPTHLGYDDCDPARGVAFEKFISVKNDLGRLFVPIQRDESWDSQF